MKILELLASKKWGADKSILLNTYKAIVRAKLDYGAIIYDSASGNILKSLNSVQATALRLVIGAFRSSINESVLAEAGEPSLGLRRYGLTLKYLATSSTSTDLHTQYRDSQYDDRPNIPQPIQLRSKSYAYPLDIQVPQIRAPKKNPFPPWCPPVVSIDLELFNRTNGKTNTPKKTYQDLYNKILLDKYKYQAKAYTDDSALTTERGCAVTFNKEELICKLLNEFSIMSCEVKAIYQAILLRKAMKTSPAVIFTDSKAALDVVANFSCTDTNIQKIQTELTNCRVEDIKISLS